MKVFGQHIDRNPEELMENYRLLGEDYAKKRARAKYLEDIEKTFLARIKNVLADQEKMTESKLERMARGSDQYEKFLVELNQARQDSYTAEVLFMAEDKKIELLRSLESSSRAQIHNMR